MTSLLSPLCFVVVAVDVDEKLAEDRLEAGLPVMLILTSSGKSAATVALRSGLVLRCFQR